jgi:hypothetical protein
MQAPEVLWFVGEWWNSTKKAAWTVSTTFIVLIVPLIISMDRESASEEQASAMHALTGAEKSRD